jgi:hypothetical protein
VWARRWQGVLADFGVATLSEWRPRGFLGTPEFAPPEMFTRYESHAAGDVYAAAIVLWCLWSWQCEPQFVEPEAADGAPSAAPAPAAAAAAGAGSRSMGLAATGHGKAGDSEPDVGSLDVHSLLAMGLSERAARAFVEQCNRLRLGWRPPTVAGTWSAGAPFARVPAEWRSELCKLLRWMWTQAPGGRPTAAMAKARMRTLVAALIASDDAGTSEPPPEDETVPDEEMFAATSTLGDALTAVLTGEVGGRPRGGSVNRDAGDVGAPMFASVPSINQALVVTAGVAVPSGIAMRPIVAVPSGIAMRPIVAVPSGIAMRPMVAVRRGSDSEAGATIPLLGGH